MRRLCSHLQELDEYVQREATVVSEGMLWSKNCRWWRYYDAILDIESLSQRFALADCVTIHEHLGTHDGAEYVFIAVSVMMQS